MKYIGFVATLIITGSFITAFVIFPFLARELYDGVDSAIAYSASFFVFVVLICLGVNAVALYFLKLYDRIYYCVAIGALQFLVGTGYWSTWGLPFFAILHGNSVSVVAGLSASTNNIEKHAHFVWITLILTAASMAISRRLINEVSKIRKALADN